MPPDLNTPGKRCKWWRIHRQQSEDRRRFAQSAFARSLKIKPGTLSDFENGHSDSTKDLHLICAGLRLNPHYVETGKGEPESSFPQEPPKEPDQWPFPAVSISAVAKLDPIELHYAESQLLSAIQEIQRNRRRTAK